MPIGKQKEEEAHSLVWEVIGCTSLTQIKENNIMTQLIILCCGRSNFHVEQTAGKQEYKLALHADKLNMVSAH